MYITAIVLAAGRGLRFKAKSFKPLVKINSKPIIIYSLKIISSHPRIKEIIVVVNTANSADIIRQIKKYRIKKIKGVVLGGRRRQDSVRHGLGAMASRTDLVLIHDGVRPFINGHYVSSLIREANRFGAAILGVPVKATIKTARKLNLIDKTLKRDSLWEIQTPQVFRKDLILEAYKKFKDTEVTDDAALVEKLSAKVKIVKGSYNNIKITTAEDLIFAEAISKKLRQ